MVVSGGGAASLSCSLWLDTVGLVPAPYGSVCALGGSGWTTIIGKMLS